MEHEPQPYTGPSTKTFETLNDTKESLDASIETQPTIPSVHGNRSPDALPPTKQTNTTQRRKRLDAPVQEYVHPPKPPNWNELSRTQRTDWYAGHGGIDVGCSTKHQPPYQPAPSFWDDMTNKGQNRWKQRHGVAAPEPDQPSPTNPVDRIPDQSQPTSNARGATKTPQDALPPIQRHRNPSPGPAQEPSPHSPSPSPPHPSSPTIFPGFQDRVTHSPRHPPSPTNLPSQVIPPHLPPIGLSPESQKPELKKADVHLTRETSPKPNKPAHWEQMSGVQRGNWNHRNEPPDWATMTPNQRKRLHRPK